MSGRSKERQELADADLDWAAVAEAVPCRGGAALAKRLFEPLGYSVEVEGSLLDERFPEWGDGPHHTLRLTGRKRLRDLLTHLYVLIPVLDADKHYWVGEAEVEKLLRKGDGWLGAHPERELIVERYLLRQRSLTRAAMARLADDDAPEPDGEACDAKEAAVEAPLQLWRQRIEAVLAALRAGEAKSVIDLGCGEGKLLRELIQDRRFERIAGMDVSLRSLERARERLRLDQLAPRAGGEVQLLHGSLLYRDRRLEGFDAAAVCEVIEHLDPPRLEAFARTVFEHARPGLVVLTTPNAEYNVKFEGLAAGAFRHGDHRFEWTRAEFQAWAGALASRFGYRVEFLPIGPEDPQLGAPTQMGVFQA
jgi:3' terminal RNA ribose 2'-O-methyltransferase Hen1